MSANELALRYSTAPAEQLIGILPVREVKEALWQEVEDEVLDEVFNEHEFELEAVAVVAESFGTAIKLAMKQPSAEAMQTLRMVIENNPGYGQEPVEG